MVGVELVCLLEQLVKVVDVPKSVLVIPEQKVRDRVPSKLFPETKEQAQVPSVVYSGLPRSTVHLKRTGVTTVV